MPHAILMRQNKISNERLALPFGLGLGLGLELGFWLGLGRVLRLGLGGSF